MPVNRSGQACALTVLTPIEPGREPALRAHLEGLCDEGSPLARVPRTHFGRWVIVPGFERLPQPYLLFTSCFDGPLDSYLDELCEGLAADGPAIWGRSGDALKRHLLEHRVDAGIFVAAYPRATVAKVRRSLALRDRAVDFAVRSQDMEPAALRDAFLEELG
jgi:hypothetical protein